MKAYTALMLSLCGAAIAGFASPAHAQFKLQETFEGTTAPGWTLSSSALLTAPSIDAAGAGWLRLTAALGTEKGLALNNAFSFGSNQPVVVQFNYVSWGGTGADGMTLFLYDNSVASPMAGALTGGGLGYCEGAGGYLAIGLDEYGNFSNPGDKCTAASGGPGRKPESLVIRGPESATNPWVSTTSIAGGIDNPGVSTRPSPKTVIFSLTPAVAPAIGYTITAQFQSASGQPFQTLFSNVAFPYVPPATLSVGFSGSTGGSTNVHELQGLAAATPDDLQVAINGPASILQGAGVTYTVTLTNNGNNAIGSSDAPTLIDSLPASVTGATWTCVGAGGGTCDASGTGSINTSSLTLPANGSVTYTITGTLDPATACASTVTNTAAAQFGSGSNFLDPDQTNNSAKVNSTVTCETTLVANPTALSYSPQQINVASASQTVTLTEGNNGTATISGISVTGDYLETNNCNATLGATQTCTINVSFKPTVTGSRNGTLTIQSNLASEPTQTAVVTLSGTGINSVPSPFSFTPLVNVDPSSTQVSNSIAVASTDVPAPISISAGGLYSINGGAFTSVPGMVSPGAQIQVQVTAAAGYSTSVSATLSIGGVSSTFTVTTGAQPVLQGGFTPVTGAVPSSVQTSNTISVTGTSIAVPISVSSGAKYSINGGAFTSAPGTVQPGDTVALQMTASSSYNTTSSSVVNIGGVTSTFSTTTGSQPVPQAGFTAVTGASVSSAQMSNPITVTSISAPAPISVSSGAEYSINGRAFTSAPGMVSPGDQVRVETAAPSTYSTSATAMLTIGGNASPFKVTTGAEPVLQGTFAPVTSAATSTTQTSNAITVTGITSPAAISVTGGAQYSINGGPFTSAPGTVQAGDRVTVRVTAPSSYSTTLTSTVTIDGVTSRFSVTTGQQPLQNVAVTGGGGAMGALGLLALALLASCRFFGLRRAPVLSSLGIVLIGALLSSPSRADDAQWYNNLYGGISVGDSTSSMTAAKLANDLRADGYQITAAGAERGTATGSFFLGYELRNNFAAELSSTYVGRIRAALQGVLPTDLGPLLADTAHIVRGSGDIIALQARYRWPLLPDIALDLRAGPYYWITTSDVYVSGQDLLHRTDRGVGYTLGVGPRFSLGRHVGVAVGAAYLNSTSQTQFWLFSASLEYHL
ncbi:MAG TPA: hypothetical protein VGI93_17720 [Steroidobacteraceae bacterium]|jgi:hypothetical protein